MAVEVGSKAPEFTLYDSDRKQRSLAEFRGKNVVLAFFPGAFTGVCTEEACAFRDSAARLNGLNAQVVGVSVDPPFSQKAWADANKLTFPLLSDFNRQVVAQYGTTLQDLGGVKGYVSSRRAVFVIDRQGVVRYRWVGEPANEPPYQEITAALEKLT